MIYVRLTKDGKYVVTVFSSSQENSTDIERSDARYIDSLTLSRYQYN